MRLKSFVWPSLAMTVLAVTTGHAADQPQWGQYHSRNMVSDETGLPESCDPATGKNIKWSIPIGTQSYATPVVSQGRVIIGTNNDEPRDPKQTEDGGVVLCVDEKDGHFCWQFVSPRLGNDRYLDQPHIGLCSPATVENGRVYIVNNRAQVLCMSLLGHGEILWRFDMPSGAGVYPHDSAHSSILIDGNYLYLNTGNGVDNTHRKIRSPDAPSLIVLDKTTGRLVARDDERIGPNIFHASWSAPSAGVVSGRSLIFFGGGDAACYALEALHAGETSDHVIKLQRAWRCDGDPTSPKKDIHSYVTNRKESPSVISGMPVFYNNRIYVTLGGDIWWGKHKAWLQCINAAGSRDIAENRLVWSYAVNRHCCATPAIYAGMVFVGDCGHQFHCVDADTGKPYWTQDVKGDVWGSALVADGRVYLGTRRGDLWTFAASKDKKVLATVHLGDPISSTPVAANGTLYIATLTRLFALRADK